MNEATIIAAVDRLNEQLRTLPDDVPCSIEEIYPEFDYPPHSPEVYLVLLEEEARAVKAKIDQAEKGRADDLKRLLAMLVECAVVLRLAGVKLESDDDQQDASSEHLAGGAETGDDPQEPPSMNGHNPS